MGIYSLKKELNELLKDEKDFLSEEEYQKVFYEEYKRILEENTIILDFKNFESVEICENPEVFSGETPGLKNLLKKTNFLITSKNDIDFEIKDKLLENFMSLETDFLRFKISFYGEDILFTGRVVNYYKDYNEFEIEPTNKY